MISTLAFVAISIIPTGILASPPHRQGEEIEQLVLQSVAHVCSNALGAETTIGGVEWDSEHQRITLRDIHVANPEGFAAGDAITLKSAEVEADLRTLLSDTPEIRAIHVTGVAINMATSLHGNNLKKLMDNTKKAMPKDMPKPRHVPKHEKRWRIDQLKVDESTASMSILGATLKRYTLDKYETSFTGPNGEGMTPREILAKVLDSVLGRIPASNAPENQPEPEHQSPAGAAFDVLPQASQSH